MTKQRPSNLAASVRQRLLNHSANTEQDFQVVLAQYAFERLLYRLGRSPGAEQFTLKGALLFLVWTGEQYRPTRDMDLMSKDARTEVELKTIFREVCTTRVDDDGLVLLEDTVDVEPIRDENEYGGMRVTLMGKLEQARIPLQIDIGFADAITPAPVLREFPALLDFAAPRIGMYPPETTIAEKFHTIAVRGILNSRMKDYYDIWALCREFESDGVVLCRAIAATFRRRKTALPDNVPVGLSEKFSSDAAKLTQWSAFIGRTPLKIVEDDLGAVVTTIREFLMPPCLAAASGRPFNGKWSKGGPWQG
jgi:hypothetical protein